MLRNGFDSKQLQVAFSASSSDFYLFVLGLFFVVVVVAFFCLFSPSLSFLCFFFVFSSVYLLYLLSVV